MGRNGNGISTTCFLALCGLAVAVITNPMQARSAEDPPNVIVVYTDDQGSVDAGCYGATDLQTPGIDRLARRGVRFTQFYAAAPVCSPSRAGLLTGRYPWRVGMEGNAGAPPPEHLQNLENAEGARSFGEAKTMAEIFADNGYATAHIGKWHLGYKPGSKPLDQGFDYSFGHIGGCIDNYTHFFYWNGPNRHDLWENNQRVRRPGEFFPDLMVEKATDYLEAHQDEPFFMYFAMNTPHYPYQGEPEWLKEYRDLEYPRNLYAAFVSTLDERIDRLIDAVDRLGLREETIIIFQPDHGHSTETRAHGGGGDNGPYRGAKFSVFEGGIRVPAIISWPGNLPEGEVRDQLAHGCDWLPTVADLCGVSLSGRDIQGKSLVKVIESKDAPSPHSVLRWKLGGQWAIRKGKWKLIHNARPTGDGPQLSKAGREWFLANLKENVGETKNYADKRPDVLSRLKLLWQE